MHYIVTYKIDSFWERETGPLSYSEAQDVVNSLRLNYQLHDVAVTCVVYRDVTSDFMQEAENES